MASANLRRAGLGERELRRYLLGIDPQYAASGAVQPDMAEVAEPPELIRIVEEEADAIGREYSSGRTSSCVRKRI